MATQIPTDEDLLKELKRLKSEGDFDQLLYRAGFAATHYPENAQLLKFLHYAQEHYVKAKCDSQIVGQLEEKKDYAALTAIYSKLLSILPNSKDLQKRLRLAQKKIQEAHEAETQEFYANAEEQIKTMIQQGDYEAAVSACHEICDQAPWRKNFIRLLVKAESLLDKKMNEALALYYEEVIPSLYKEYETNKEDFIKI